MDQLVQIKKRTKPHNVLLAVDAMTGQDAVNVAEQFAEATEFDGVLMTKLDGDARGGAALSVKAVTGKPILYASTGEKLDALERFHPDRMAQRILGMGDVLSLIEKAEQEIDVADAEELERKMRRNEFTLDDFLKQLKQVRKMGPLTSMLGMMPGMGKAMKELKSANVDERELDRLEAIILSMTPEERAQPRRDQAARAGKRIATGSGTNVQAVNQLVKQFDQMRKMMKKIASGKMADPEAMMRQRWAAAGTADSGCRVEHAGAAPVTSAPHLMAVRIRLRRVGFQQEPDLAHRRRRQALAARRPHDRDDRQLQPADGAFADHDRHERAQHWLDHGAQPRRTVAKLLRTEGVDGGSGT